MALLKKVNPAWRPSENLGLGVGETQEISDYVTLVRQGLAILVDEAGNEMPLPGETLTCPMCYQKVPGVVSNFTQHVAEKHSGASTVAKEELKEAEVASIPDVNLTAPAAQLTTAEKRLAALTKARAAKLAKAEEKVA